ncbi:MAG: energy transducer TonB [Marinilabiliales bacterium]|nr:MAG: energy transducer TonB [Marinilabiliales bacterium]
MKAKKTPKADLEKKRGLFLEIGLILALGICLAAFEWPSREVETQTLGNLTNSEEIVEEMIITRETPPPPPKPEIKEPEPVVLELKVVDNKKDVKKIDWNSELKDRNPPIIIISDGPDVPDEKTEPVNWVDVKTKPQFPGGDAALLRFVVDNTKYPEIPKEANIDGKVYVQFIIDEKGKVTNPSIIKGVDPYLDAEALRVVSLIPDWSPGMQRDKPVPVIFILPINFVLK